MPIGHEQKDGDYAKSWQCPGLLWNRIHLKCQNLAKQMVNELGGYGVFGVEFFVKDAVVYFNEIKDWNTGQDIKEVTPPADSNEYNNIIKQVNQHPKAKTWALL